MNAQQVINRVAVVFQLEPTQITVGSRTAHLVAARQAAAFRMYFGERMSYSDIARALGYRDHSTAISAVQAAALRAKRDPTYSDKITQLGEM